MVWMMTMPSGMSFKVIAGNINSEGYIKLLTQHVVVMIKLNYGDNWFLQEDNTPVHKSRKVQYFMMQSGISVLEWSAKAQILILLRIAGKQYLIWFTMASNLKIKKI